MANAAELLVGRSVGHEWAVFMAISGHFPCPPVGSSSWPLTDPLGPGPCLSDTSLQPAKKLVISIRKGKSSIDGHLLYPVRRLSHRIQPRPRRLQPSADQPTAAAKTYTGPMTIYRSRLHKCQKSCAPTPCGHLNKDSVVGTSSRCFVTPTGSSACESRQKMAAISQAWDSHPSTSQRAVGQLP